MPIFAAEALVPFTRSLFKAGGLPASPRAEGVEEIQIPGGPERKEKTRRGRHGIPLDDGT